MLELARLVQHSKLSEEGCKETSVGGHILHPHSLADGVHGEGGHPQVDGPDPDPGRDDRPNGGATGTVVPHNKLLHWRDEKAHVAGIQSLHWLHTFGCCLS